MDEFEMLINDNPRKTKDTITLGDFNIHVDNSQGDNFKKLTKSLNLVQHVKEPTHERGHILDLVLTHASNNLVSDTTVETNHMSDHHTVLLNLAVGKPKPTYRVTQSRNVRKVDLTNLKQSIDERIDSLSTVKSKMDELNKTIPNVLDVHDPHKDKENNHQTKHSLVHGRDQTVQRKTQSCRKNMAQIES